MARNLDRLPHTPRVIQDETMADGDLAGAGASPGRRTGCAGQHPGHARGGERHCRPDLDEAAADALWEATASDDEEDCDLYLDEDLQAAVDDALYEATDPVSDVTPRHFGQCRGWSSERPPQDVGLELRWQAGSRPARARRPQLSPGETLHARARPGLCARSRSNRQSNQAFRIGAFAAEQTARSGQALAASRRTCGFAAHGMRHTGWSAREPHATFPVSSPRRPAERRNAAPCLRSPCRRRRGG